MPGCKEVDDVLAGVHSINSKERIAVAGSSMEIIWGTRTGNGMEATRTGLQIVEL